MVPSPSFGAGRRRSGHDGIVILTGLDIRNGASTLGGAGVWAQLHNGSGLIISNCRIEDNRADGSGDVEGGGLSVWVTDSSALNLGDTVVLGNQVHSTDSGAAGGGAELSFESTSTGLIHGCRFVGNHAAAENNQETGGGVFLGNGGTSPTQRVQASVIASGTSQNTFSDSVVAASDSADTGGVESYGYGGTVKIINTTVAENAYFGPQSQGNRSAVLLANCIVYGNAGGDSNGDAHVTQDHNLIGTDPLFVDAMHGDFRVRDGSPAIDAGSDAQRTDLDTIDLMGLPRSQAGSVDCGAHEHRTSTTRVAAVTHTIGFNGTPWRSDIAVSNPSASDASVAYTYRQGGNAQTISGTVPAGATMSWQDFLVDRFGKSPSVTETGSLQVYSSNPALLVSSRPTLSSGSKAPGTRCGSTPR